MWGSSEAEIDADGPDRRTVADAESALPRSWSSKSVTRSQIAAVAEHRRPKSPNTGMRSSTFASQHAVAPREALRLIVLRRADGVEREARMVVSRRRRTVPRRQISMMTGSPSMGLPSSSVGGDSRETVPKADRYPRRQDDGARSGRALNQPACRSSGSRPRRRAAPGYPPLGVPRDKRPRCGYHAGRGTGAGPAEGGRWWPAPPRPRRSSNVRVVLNA
jgi:hypothetical protein